MMGCISSLCMDQARSPEPEFDSAGRAISTDDESVVVTMHESPGPCLVTVDEDNSTGPQLVMADGDNSLKPELVQANNKLITGSYGCKLKQRDISQVTDIISAKYRRRFAVEYLDIGPNEFDTIQCEAESNHHDTLFECITRWKNRTEVGGNNAKDELIKSLTMIRKEHGWFSGQDMAFLTDVRGMEIPEKSMIPCKIMINVLGHHTVAQVKT